MRSTLLLCLVLDLSGCGATWEKQAISPQHRLPRRTELCVSMTDRALESDAGMTAALVDTLTRELRQHGYEAQASGNCPKESKLAARVELRVLTADEGNPKLRAVGGAVPFPGIGGLATNAALVVGGASELVVECSVLHTQNGQITFVGRVAAESFKANSHDNAKDAGDRVGAAIADAIMAGQEAPQH